MVIRRSLLVLIALGLVFVAGCTAATPSATQVPTAAATRLTAAAPTAAPATRPAATAPAATQPAPTAASVTARPATTAAPAQTTPAAATTAARSTATTATVAPVTVTAPITSTAARSASYENITFSYPAALAQNAAGVSVPAEVGGKDAAWWMPAPKHPEIKFSGYVLPKTFHEPRVIVYPVAEFTAVNPQAAKTIEALRQLLKDKPANPTGDLPLLPLFNAQQQMHAGVKYLPFASGQGVRFLTQYAQYPAPVNNTDLFYTFQGLTTDGKYYVAAILPVSQSALPASAEAQSATERAAMTANFAKYIEDVAKALNAQPATGFKPGLGELDAVVGSIAVK